LAAAAFQLRGLQSFFFCGTRSRLWLERQQAQQHHGQRRVFIRGQAQFGTPVQAEAVEQLGFIGRHQGGQAL